MFSNGIPAPLPPQKSLRTVYHQLSPSAPALLDRPPTTVRLATDEPTVILPTSPYPVQMIRNPSISRSPRALVNQTDLIQEVQCKPEEATASLQRAPSAKYHETNASSISPSCKRITPPQISTPRVVSASTSMDTIPLHLPSVASGNMRPQKPATLGQCIRRWVTLREEPATPTGKDISPFPLDARSAQLPPPAQIASYTLPSVNFPQPSASASLTETGRPKDPLPRPTATAGSGLKGFMSRFRRPPMAEVRPEPERYSVEEYRPPRSLISKILSVTGTSASTRNTKSVTSSSHSIDDPPLFDVPATSSTLLTFPERMDCTPSEPPANLSKNQQSQCQASNKQALQSFERKLDSLELPILKDALGKVLNIMSQFNVNIILVLRCQVWLIVNGQNCRKQIKIGRS
jgi:serine/arginine repetitive matrix protein 2